MTAGYVYFLRVVDQKVAVSEARRRAENPVQYLNDVRQGQGFHRFLAEFRQIYGYDRLQSTVPPFLLGRWSLADAPKRVSDEYVPEPCGDSVAIEDGRIKTFGKAPIDMPVSYGIEGSTVQARTANGALIPIRLAVSLGVLLVAWLAFLTTLSFSRKGFEGRSRGRAG